ncbi:hypothetical protein [Marinimicrobium alkaliphilum]|uniref:hypothetical protein n=1 Tax=Marinimicrobium alkaliphilum TaxID=2202654 RepID=UPI000DB9D11C|nr:hypothetical protein [Marinimicrobium alkaliphilum]
MRPGNLLLIWILTATLIGCAQTPTTDTAAQPEPPPEPVAITDAHRAYVREQADLGLVLFEKDEMAAIATQILFEERVLPFDERVDGWVVETRGEYDFPIVYFLGPGPDGIRSYHAVGFPYGEPRYTPSNQSTERLTGMYSARTQALNSLTYYCAERYNTVVLEDEGHWLVYTMPATLEDNVMLVGGFHRVVIDKADDYLVAAEPLTRSCLELPLDNNHEVLYVTHIVDDTPTALHSFLSLSYDVTLYVGTRTGVWRAQDGQLTPVKIDADSAH